MNKTQLSNLSIGKEIKQECHQDVNRLLSLQLEADLNRHLISTTKVLLVLVNFNRCPLKKLFDNFTLTVLKI